MWESWAGESWVIAWLVRATALGLITAVAAAVVQRRSAELAHRLWVAALAGVLLLPLLGPLVPTWSVPTGGARVVEVGRPADAVPVTVVATAPAVPDDPDRLPTAPDVGPTAPTADPPTAVTEPTQPAAPSPVPAPRPTAGVPWALAAWVGWAIVATALLGRLCVSAVALGRLIRRSPAAPPGVRDELADVAAGLSVRRRFDARVLPAGAMPMACWLGRWVVLLPADFGRWPAGLRWTVAAHELGHIARGDAWSDLLTQVVCRLGWPHPLLWLAARAVPRLRERACDEWVLATGRVGLRDYAGHLLDVVARCPATGGALAPAMARAVNLERRLRSVLAGRPPVPHRKLARLAVTAAALAATAVVACAQPTPSAKDIPNQPAVPVNQRTAEPVPADGPAISIAGIVTGPDGRPIAGATVVLRAKIGGHQYSFGVRHNRDILARTTAGADGGFIFKGIGLPPRLEEVIDGLMRGRGGAELLAWADGRGLVWADVQRVTGNEPVRLVLPPEAAVTGVVRNEAGRGVPGVTVSVGNATRATADADGFFHQPGDLNLTLSEVSFDATTDAEGRFTLRHLPPDYRLLAVFERPGWQRKALFIDTGSNTELTEVKTSGGRGEPVPVQRSPLNVTLAGQRSLTVKVTDHTGRPVRDGAVEVIDGQRHFAGRADVDDGVARVAAGPPGRYEFIYAADPLHPRLSTRVSADVPAGDDSPTVEIRLPEPRWLTGRAVDADTGRGLVGVYVSVWEKRDDGSVGSTAVSGAGGEFRIPFVPGRGSARVHLPVFGYLPDTIFTNSDRATSAGIPVDVPRDGEPAPVTVRIGRGLAVRGTVRDRDGKPVAGAVITAQNDDRPFRSATTT
ncbi:MAG TPA: M56 family metallopeptidase, partial [Gemmataceae bacterium]